jgi:TnpA family transposase
LTPRLCPRLKELSDRHLFLPRGSEIPENLKGICHATIDPQKAAKQGDSMVHLFASVQSGHSDHRVGALRFCRSG